MKKVFVTLEVIFDPKTETISYNLEGQDNTPLKIVEEVLSDFMADLHNQLKNQPNLTLKDVHERT